MSRRDYLKYLGFQVAIAQLHLKELKQQPPMTNDKLPELITKEIEKEATRLYPLNNTKPDRLEIGKHVGYIAGATAWAPWKVRYDELKAENEGLKKSMAHVMDVFKMMTNMPVPATEKEYMSWFVYVKNMAGGAISEWEAEKEVQEFKDGKVKEAITKENNTMENKKSTASYTKGEWYLQEYTDAYTNIVRCDNGKGHETLFIANTPQSNLPEARANAQLMAAAPDLLESLQEIIAIIDRNHAATAWVKAKAAIEKAIGKLTNPQK